MKNIQFLSVIIASVFTLYGTHCFAANMDKCFEINRKLGIGINLGNALEAPKEGDWGVTLQPEYFQIIKQAGFDSVRIPIRWSAHALHTPPYTIEPEFFARVDWAIENAKLNDLSVIINVHHYGQMYADPNNNSQRLIQLWNQIAQRYKNQPDTVVFELLNEPCKNLTSDKWNKLLVDILAEIRKIDPDRTVMIGPANWNNIHSLKNLILPQNDQNIIVTCHYYEPFTFTHQGADWTGEHAKEWLGTTWSSTEKQRLDLLEDFRKVAVWAKQNNRPINIGEFGAYSKADMKSRAKWTSFVAKTASKYNFSCHYWEFCSGFGAYDKENNKWRQPLLDALINEDTKLKHR